jgi:archaemetzincin
MIDVVCIGEVEEHALASAEAVLAGVLPTATRRLPALPRPAYALEPHRQQYNATLILRDLVARRAATGSTLIGVTGCDLAIPMLTFLFGQAQLNGPNALVSLARLRQEFYGLPENAELLAARLAKEMLHELGHTAGLTHCPDPACPMSLSTTISEVDRKGTQYCGRCAPLARHRWAHERHGELQ